MSTFLRKKCDQHPLKVTNELFGSLDDISDEPGQDLEPERNEDADLFVKLAMEEEEERSYNEKTGDIEPWTDISDSWVRSDNDGWYYDDED